MSFPVATTPAQAYAVVNPDEALRIFAKIKATIKSLIKSGSTTVEQIELATEKRPAQLYESVERLITHVRRELNEKQGQDRLIIIIDGLEKIPLRQVEGMENTHNKLFLHQARHLKAPRCHLVYALPLTLLSHEKIIEDFSFPFLMPMVHIRRRNGQPDTKAIGALQEVVAHRVSPELFAANVTETLAEASGGHIRDFLSLVREAAGLAIGEPRVTQNHAQRAISKLVALYNRTIQQEFLSSLDHVDKNEDLLGLPQDIELINRLLVLEYINGDPWWALHPCVKKAPRYVKAPRVNRDKDTPTA